MINSVFEFDEIGSTNDQARTLINEGVFPPFWVMAYSQTKGRGRLSREWHSPRGNLYCSGVFGFERKIPDPLISFVSAIALLEAIRYFAPQIDAKLKWPNDILVEGGKISGILLETHSFQSQNFLIIGFGLNIKSAPDLEGRKTAFLAQYIKTQPSPKEFLDVLSQKFEFFYNDFRRNGFGNTRKIWLENAYGIGQELIIVQNGKTIRGLFNTINESGELHLETENGDVLINSGDVFFQHN